MAPAVQAAAKAAKSAASIETFADAQTLVNALKPDRPTFGLRPRAAGRAAQWFMANFPGDVAYAVKANSSPFLLGALYGAGVRHYDVASLPEIEEVASIPGVAMHFMHPVKSRNAVRRAFAEFGVRSFSLDTEDELKKILEETGGAKDLTLWVRIAVAAKDAKLPLERMFGTTGSKAVKLIQKTRAVAKELGITFHVGSQTVTPEAYTSAIAEVRALVTKADVAIERLDVGGGFPSVYANSHPTRLEHYMSAIKDAFAAFPGHEKIRLMCEPGRALVAEAESLIVRVNGKKGNELYINDGAYGALFDAAHLNWIFPVRHLPIGARPMHQTEAERDGELTAFSFWGPTCDSIDCMKGPFMLPASIREGDYIEIGNIGAYGRAIAGRFNGFGTYEQAILNDPPQLSMYGDSSMPAAAPARGGAK
ncbi:MAG: hypothetical protein RL291_496 [Pseudomonadota bacterium]